MMGLTYIGLMAALLSAVVALSLVDPGQSQRWLVTFLAALRQRSWSSRLVDIEVERFHEVVDIATFGLLGVSGLSVLVAGLGGLFAEKAVLDQLPLGLPWLH